MHKYRILTNGVGGWRVQKRVFLFFWKKITQSPTLTEAIDFIKEYETYCPKWKVYEYVRTDSAIGKGDLGDASSPGSSSPVGTS